MNLCVRMCVRVSVRACVFVCKCEGLVSVYAYVFEYVYVYVCRVEFRGIRYNPTLKLRFEWDTHINTHKHT